MNKKKVLNSKVIILLTFLTLLGSIYYLFIMENKEYYTQVEKKEIKTIKKEKPIKYKYTLKSYNINGRKKELILETTKKYLEKTYLKLTINGMNKITKVKEVNPNELPSIVIEKIKKEHINLPETDKIRSIILTENSNKKEITNQNSIKEIINALKKSNLTNKESIQDTPINQDELITINFLFEEKESTLFVYKKKEKYYIEQPYNAIYRISKENYQKIKKYTE